MKKNFCIKLLKKILLVFLAAFINALSIKLIVQPRGFLSGGVSGLSVLISRYVALNIIDKAYLESLLYSILYVLFNVPIFIFGFRKVGKKFVIYSAIDVFVFSSLVSIIPSSWYGSFQLDSIDPLTLSILAGILSGVASSIAFSSSFSQGGTEIISMYLSRSKGKSIGNYNLAMNVIILLLGGLAFKNYASLIYTVIYFFASSLVVNNLYISHKKMLIEVVTEKEEELTYQLMKESHHGCTILDVIGAYSKKSKKMLRIVVSSNQIKTICGIIKNIDPESFTTVINVHQINGKFYIPPIN